MSKTAKIYSSATENLTNIVNSINYISAIAIPTELRIFMLLPSAEAPALYSDKNLLAIIKKKSERAVDEGKRALFFSNFPLPIVRCALFPLPWFPMTQNDLCRGESFHAEISLTTLAFGGFLPGWITPPSICLVLHLVQLRRLFPLLYTSLTCFQSAC